MPSASLRFAGLSFDDRDPEIPARFWAAALTYTPGGGWMDGLANVEDP